MQDPFERFFHDFCALVGAAPPELVTGEDGSRWAILILDEVEVALLHAGAQDAQRFHTRVVFGGLQPHDDARQWADLLEANYSMLGHGRPAFSRDAYTADVILQQAWQVHAGPHALLEAVGRQVRAARQWQAGEVDCAGLKRLGPVWDVAASEAAAGNPDSVVGATAEAAPAVARFAALCREFQQELGGADLGVLDTPGGAASFVVEVEGVEVQVFHVPDPGDWVFVEATLGAAGEWSDAQVRELAESNAWLLTEPSGAAVCRRPITGDYLLRSGLPLGSAGELGERIARAARAAALLRQALVQPASDAHRRVAMGRPAAEWVRS